MLSFENLQLNGYYFAEEPYEEIEEDEETALAEDENDTISNGFNDDDEPTNYDNLFEGSFLADMWD